MLDGGRWSAVMEQSGHESYMRQCLELALLARARGDHPVGSLIVLEGNVIGRGAEAVHTRCDVTAHAEIVALRDACATLARRDLTGSTLYTTVEPCVMCAYAIRLARIGTVVAGARPQGTGADDQAARLLGDARLLPGRPPAQLVRGILEEECRALLPSGP
jgi:tRNA(adenine34) deaminase